jgi:hypothetical protein
MTVPTDSQQLESYVPVFDDFTETWDDARPILVEHLKKISNGLNDREIGFFLDEELLSGKAFFPSPNIVPGNPQQMRQILRKVVDCSPLIIGTTTVAHGILFDINFSLIALWVGCTNSTALLAQNLTDTSVIMNVNNLVITSPAVYDRAYAVIEYLQEI